MPDEYNDSNFTEVNISHDQRENCIIMDSLKKNTTENNAFSSNDFFNGFISGILSSAATVAIVYLGYRFMKTHHYKSDSTTDSTGNITVDNEGQYLGNAGTVAKGDLTIESQILRPLDASNCEEFFKDELSRVKALAYSKCSQKREFFKRDLGLKMKEFAKSETYTEDFKARLNEMLNKSCIEITQYTKSYGYHQSYIDMVAKCMEIQKKKDSTSIFSTTNNTQPYTSSQALNVINELQGSKGTELLGDILPEDTNHMEL